MPVEPLGPSTEARKFRRIGGYGDPGGAKTSWFRSVIEKVGAQRVWAIACGTGISVLEDILPESRIIRLAHRKDVETLDQDKLLSQLAVNYERAFEFVRRNLKDVDWLLVDDWTRVCKGLETSGRLQMERGEAYLIDRGENKPPVPDTQALYGHLANAQLRGLEKTIQLPVNLFMTFTGETEYETELVVESYTYQGKEKRTEKNRRTGVSYAAPAIAGKKFLEDFMAIMDAVLYFHVVYERMPDNQSKRITRCLVRCRDASKKVKAKLRVPVGVLVPDIFSIGQRDESGAVTVSSTDYTLVSLIEKMAGTNPAIK
jgi:hypothetical protein